MDDFTAEAQLDKAERQGDASAELYSYCNEQLQAGKRLSWNRCLKSFRRGKSTSAILPKKGYEAGRAFRRITVRCASNKYAGSGGGLTINFDAMLLGERIFWDPATDTLTIKRDAAESARISCSDARPGGK